MAKAIDREKQVVFEVSRDRKPSATAASWLELLLGVRKVPVKIRAEGKK